MILALIIAWATSGYQIFSGAEQIVYTTNSSITSGSYIVEIQALRGGHLHIEVGKIRSMS